MLLARTSLKVQNTVIIQYKYSLLESRAEGQHFSTGKIAAGHNNYPFPFPGLFLLTVSILLLPSLWRNLLLFLLDANAMGIVKC